ncbi:MAG: XRE family transcriptional regulator [Alphaproteobacteria bacterium]|nr:XRE family transcriptional regulator [Alphaproteobacteria bacterium]
MPNPIDVHVGRRLRQQREMRGMPQKELARRLGISFQQVQKYESGANRISASKLWEACGVLEVGPNYFFEGLERGGGGRSRHGASEAATEYDAGGPHARQVLDLNQSFHQIRDTRVRRQLVQLIKALVEDD